MIGRPPGPVGGGQGVPGAVAYRGVAAVAYRGVAAVAYRGVAMIRQEAVPDRPDRAIDLRLTWRWLLALVLSALLVLTAIKITNATGAGAAVLPKPDLSHVNWPANGTVAPTAPGSADDALVVHDDKGDNAALAQVYATLAANLCSHFGKPTVEKASLYRAGDAKKYRAVVYIGAEQGQPLNPAFLRDVLSGSRPVLWLGGNLDQLIEASGAFYKKFGWRWSTDGYASANGVTYKGFSLSRDPSSADALMRISNVNPQRAEVLATATKADGSQVPWAVRGENLTYVAEVPLDAADAFDDRYLALSDLLFDVFGSSSSARHRALVRLEDIGPNTDPVQLLQLARYLYENHVPYSFALYPVYVDAVTSKPRRTIRLSQEPRLIATIAYMLQHGGTMVLHGYSHQFGDVPNPFSGQSAADFEFFRVHFDSTHTLIYDGPVPGDSVQWATDRINAAISEVRAAGLPRPKIFEFPHYGASEADYQSVQGMFDARYDRPQIFSPAYRTGPMSPYMFEQFFPYLVHDAYGTTVIPENLGYVEGPPVQSAGPGSPQAIVDAARANLVVRDGVASFYFHPYLGKERLGWIVQQMREMGYRFVAPAQLS